MPIVKGKKYTAEEFFDITPESNSERYELIDGEITALAAPSIVHQRLVTNISSEIRQFIIGKGRKCETFVSPFDVKLNDFNIVQPDILVVCDPDKLSDGKRCNGAPDLAIEVTSSNSSRDYIDKLYLYRNSGVREYWIVDPDKEKAAAYFLEKDNEINFYSFEQDIPVGIFDNELKINISELIIFRQ